MKRFEIVAREVSGYDEYDLRSWADTYNEALAEVRFLLRRAGVEHVRIIEHKNA